MAQQKLLKGNDGFYVGRVLKNGSLSKDAYHISNHEIALMFEDYLRGYCERNKTNILLAYRKGRLVYETLLHNDDGTVGNKTSEPKKE
jgi:hypothetical protein